MFTIMYHDIITCTIYSEMFTLLSESKNECERKMKGYHIKEREQRHIKGVRTNDMSKNRYINTGMIRFYACLYIIPSRHNH